MNTINKGHLEEKDKARSSIGLHHGLVNPDSKALTKTQENYDKLTVRGGNYFILGGWFSLERLAISDAIEIPDFRFRADR